MRRRLACCFVLLRGKNCEFRRAARLFASGQSGGNMKTKIVTVSTFEEAADAAAWVWQDAGKPKLLRFEGFDGVGKSALAKLVVPRIGATYISGDAFASTPEVPTHYAGCLRTQELDAAISEAVRRSAPVVLDAVCLDVIAPSARWGHGFVLYVKRLSFNSTDPIWHMGFDLDDEDATPTEEPHRGILEYHRLFKPHARANLIIELPEEGHTIYNFAFDRGRCFDPADAKVLRPDWSRS
jgi:hypothetical protein